MSRHAEGNATPSSLAPGSALRSCKLFFVSEELTSQALAHYRSGSDAQAWSIASDTPTDYLQQLAARQRFQRPNQRTGQPVYIMHRRDIEQRDAFQIAQQLTGAFDRFCAKTPASA